MSFLDISLDGKNILNETTTTETSYIGGKLSEMYVESFVEEFNQLVEESGVETVDAAIKNCYKVYDELTRSISESVNNKILNEDEDFQLLLYSEAVINDVVSFLEANKSDDEDEDKPNKYHKKAQKVHDKTNSKIIDAKRNLLNNKGKIPAEQEEELRKAINRACSATRDLESALYTVGEGKNNIKDLRSSSLKRSLTDLGNIYSKMGKNIMNNFIGKYDAMDKSVSGDIHDHILDTKCDKDFRDYLKKEYYKPVEKSIKDLKKEHKASYKDLSKQVSKTLGESYNLSESGLEKITDLYIELTEDVTISIPGGLSERPSGAPKDVSVPTPSKTEITDAQYKSALAALKKSFKESAELIDILEQADVVEESANTIDDEQNEYTELAICEAILDSFLGSPMFERVTRKENKDDIKAIVEQIKPNLCKKTFKSKYDAKLFKPAVFFRTFTKPGALFAGIGSLVATTGHAVPGVAAVTLASDANITTNRNAFATWWNTRFWQVVAGVVAEKEDLVNILKDINEEYSGLLGEYKVIAVPTTESLSDIFRTRLHYKNHRTVYFLIVDKTGAPKEMKDAIKDLDNAVNEANKSDEENTSEAKTESTENLIDDSES